MKKAFLFVFLLPAVALMLGGCFPSFIFESLMEQNSLSPQEYFDEQENFENTSGPVDPYSYQYEALDWLTKNTNSHALAKSRFRNTDEAIDLVKTLYEREAVVVLVTGITQEADVKNTQSEPYADSLIVVLPKDIHSRTAIQTLYRKEVNLFGCNGGSEEAGLMGDTIMFSWYETQED